MSLPRMTVGMAVYEDFDGLWPTLQTIRSFHKQALPYLDFVVIDNSPNTNQGNLGRQLIGSIVADKLPEYKLFKNTVIYKGIASPVGTSVPRNAIFDAAQTDYVMVIDPHVIMQEDSIMNLLRYFELNPDTKDLLSGPIVYDNLADIETHFDDFFRGQMWGAWGRAWECKCRNAHNNPGIDESKHPLRFSIQQKDNAHLPEQHPLRKTCEFIALAPGYTPATFCSRCNSRLNTETLPFNGHQQALMAEGYYRMATDPNDEPFEIPGMGLGMFACRKDAWLGFNNSCIGFGGEEMYIHEKFRRAGRKNLCLPNVRWLHRFGRSHGVPYPLRLYEKVRNYVLEFNELGMDLTPVYEHWVSSGKLMSQEDWDYLIADPITRIALPQKAVYNTGRPQPERTMTTPQDILTWCKSIERDLNQHLQLFSKLAGYCNTVTEFSKRRESTVGWVAGIKEGGKINSYLTEKDDLQERLKEVAYASKATVNVVYADSPEIQQIEDTDLLFIDTTHTFSRLSEELKKFSPNVKRFIVMHDTHQHAKRGEDGNEPGLLEAIRIFLEANDNWFIAHHTPAQYGLTVLSCNQDDIPPKKIWLFPPDHGPGTELKKILKSIGIAENPGCDCNKKAEQMDIWGIEGCEGIHDVDEKLFGEDVKAGTKRFDIIVGWMRNGHGRWGWKDRMTAAAKAVTTGLAFHINWTDPFPGIINEAIRRAKEERQKKESEISSGN